MGPLVMFVYHLRLESNVFHPSRSSRDSQRRKKRFDIFDISFCRLSSFSSSAFFFSSSSKPLQDPHGHCGRLAHGVAGRNNKNHLHVKHKQVRHGTTTTYHNVTFVGRCIQYIYVHLSCSQNFNKSSVRATLLECCAFITVAATSTSSRCIAATLEIKTILQWQVWQQNNRLTKQSMLVIIRSFEKPLMTLPIFACG